MEGMEKIIENLHSLKKQSNLGQPTQISKDSDVCPLCNGTGWIPVEKTEKQCLESANAGKNRLITID